MFYMLLSLLWFVHVILVRCNTNVTYMLYISVLYLCDVCIYTTQKKVKDILKFSRRFVQFRELALFRFNFSI